MRLIKKYFFPISAKTSYSVWLDIIHQFLSQNGLASHRFLYHFEEMINSAESIADEILKSGCERIRRDCPSLGEVRVFNGSKEGLFDKLWLSNVDEDVPFSEEKLLPLIKKIPRSYGFSESNLYFFDIDFFGKRTFFEREDPARRRGCKIDIYGSGITLHRATYLGSYLELSIDVMHDGAILDAEPYRVSLQKLLPECTISSYLSLYLSEKEKRQLEQVNQAAFPVLEQCRRFFEERIPCAQRQNHFPSHYSVANPMKELAKKYGYVYRRLWAGGLFLLEKRTARGNLILINVDSGPSRYELNAIVVYCGVGFKHRLNYSMHAPTNQQETDAALETVMRAAVEFEQTLLPSLDLLFPEAPDWYEPSEMHPF